MRRHLKIILITSAVIIGGLVLTLALLARKPQPDTITYGMSYNMPYVLELGLDPTEVLEAFFTELNVRHIRLSAHWNLIEPQRDMYDFAWMDAQLEMAEEHGAEVIFGVGRKLPRWPECHAPSWARALSWDEQKVEIMEYVTAVVNRYKDSPAITHWQVENEPYLEVFAKEHCGEFDEEFLEEEIALVRTLDAKRPILITDSGNLGTWRGAYTHGDSFGTSVYVYFWNPELGQFKTILPPWFYRVKEGVMEAFYGERETILIELSLEPWLLEPVTEVPIEVQYSRMNAEKFDEIIEYAKNTRYDTQYLWGGEWWYWLKLHGSPEMWDRGVQLFNTTTSGQDVVSTIDISTLPESQQKAIRTFGFEGSNVVVTNDMVLCAEDAVGKDRFDEIIGGIAPTPLESLQLLPCFKK